MKKIRAILVDDEESARDVLENLLLRFCPDVELIAKCESVLEAVEVIKKEKPDLVFLDIEMPNYAGYELVNLLPKTDFEIIFVTAYDQYAIRAFETAAIDYLLKPIDIERLKVAITRVLNQHNLQQQAQRLSLFRDTLQDKQIKSIIISDKGQQHVIAIESIVAIEAQESYSFVHTSDKKYTVSKNLKHFETIFSGNVSFMRVHKSWIISKKHILNYSKTDLSISLTKDIVARLSKYKKVEFEEAIYS
jgi:two-component system, LytTR family, response regulator